MPLMLPQLTRRLAIINKAPRLEMHCHGKMNSTPKNLCATRPPTLLTLQLTPRRHSHRASPHADDSFISHRWFFYLTQI